jgi:hypothetical protein
VLVVAVVVSFHSWLLLWECSVSKVVRQRLGIYFPKYSCRVLLACEPEYVFIIYKEFSEIVSAGDSVLVIFVGCIPNCQASMKCIPNLTTNYTLYLEMSKHSSSVSQIAKQP